MRHNKKFNHLSRKSAHREAMLANMTISLIMHKRIVTTLAKAKALRIYAEPIINRAKDDTTASRRIVFKHLQNKEAVKELYSTVAAKIADRRDNAKTCFIELVDFNEAMLEAKNQEKAAAKKTTRRSRKKAAAPATEAPAAPAEEAPKTEE